MAKIVEVLVFIFMVVGFEELFNASEQYIMGVGSWGGHFYGEYAKCRGDVLHLGAVKHFRKPVRWQILIGHEDIWGSHSGCLKVRLEKGDKGSRS